MSLSIEEVIDTLRQLKVPSDLIVKAETQLEQVEAEKKDEAASAAPKQKTQLVTVILDPEHKLADAGDFVSLVVQINEGLDVGTTLGRIHQSVYDQRAAAKRKTKRGPILTLTDAADGLKRGFSKVHGVQFKTKEPVRVLVTDGIIPLIAA